MNPGLHPKTSRAAYEAVDAANFSVLKYMEQSPAHALEAKMHPKAPTPAMELGTHIHAAVLEPARFDREYFVWPKMDRRTTAGKASWASFEALHRGDTIVDSEDWMQIKSIRDAVWDHPTAAALLRGASTELAVIWKHERTGLLVKSLLDAFNTYEGWSVVIDVKSCEDASPRAFAKDVVNREYHSQAALYLNGLNALAPMQRRFLWIAVEKEAPFAVAVYEATDQMLMVGEARAERWLDQYAACKESGVWPAYGTDVMKLELPAWAMKEIQ